PEFKELRANEAKHQIETVGKDLRKMFSWSAQAIDTDYVEGSAAR
ncbi:MAG TPA: ketol-acid reductoisomerase, partial [Brevibacterium sp.]|nr:ketol-acid reductoisomerase [Brevibacterium sp.]